MALYLRIIDSIPQISTSSRSELKHFIEHLQDKSKHDTIDISNITLESLLKSLLHFPYETEIVMQHICISPTIMNNLKQNALSYCTNQDNDSYIQTIYALLSKLNVCEVSAVQSISTMIKDNKLGRNLVYLSLLVNKDKTVVNKLIEYEKSTFTLDAQNPSSLFEYTINKNEHWFLDIINGISEISNIDAQCIQILKLFRFTNSDINFSEIDDCMSRISIEHVSSDLNCFIKEILNLINVVNFCKPKTNDLNENAICIYNSEHSILATLSNYVDLKVKTYWRNITEILNMGECSEDTVEIFNCFCILCNILECLQFCKNSIPTKCDDTTLLLNETKDMFLQLSNVNLQLEVLENVYVLIFLRIEHLNSLSDFDIKMNHTFLCDEKEIRMIVFFVRSCLDLINKNVGYKNERFIFLQKCVADAIWRLELLNGTIGNVNSYIEYNEFIHFMLAPPKSLMNICLNNGHFDKAHQVSQIFDMDDDDLANETQFMEDFVQLKEDIKKILKINKIQRETPNIQMHCDVCVKNTFKKFKSYLLSQMQNNDETTEMQMNLENIVESKMFIIVFDLLLTEPKIYEDCLEMLEILDSYDSTEIEKNTVLFNFYKNVREIFKIINLDKQLSFSDILNSSLYQVNAAMFNETLEKYVNIVSNLKECFSQIRNENESLNYEYISPKIFLQLGDMCQNSEPNYKEKINVFQRLLNYLKLLSQVITVNKESSKRSQKDGFYFNILLKDRSSIVGKLIYEQSIEPSSLEIGFNKLKLDLMYHIASNSFPQVELSNRQNFISNNNFAYTPTKDIITYFQKRNWLLAYLMIKIHNATNIHFDLNAQRTKCFENLLKLNKTQNLKDIFNNNEAIVVLQQNIDPKSILDYFQTNVEMLENDFLRWDETDDGMTNSCTLETGEEILEDDINVSKWKRFYNILDSLPEKTLEENAIIDIYNATLRNIITECYETDYYKYVEYIKDSEIRIETMLNNFHNWPGEFCVDAIRSEISMENDTSDDTRYILQVWCDKIEVYESIRQLTTYKAWHEIHDLCTSSPEYVLDILLNTTKIELLLKYLKIHALTNDTLITINASYFLSLFGASCNLNLIEELLKILPSEHSLDICQQLLKLLQIIRNLQFIIDYLINHSELEKKFLKNMELSLKMIACFTESEQGPMLRLIDRPLYIIEQLLMNTKLEKLAQVIGAAQDCILNIDDGQELDITVTILDTLLRRYAEKSLDFRVITQPVPILRAESKLMQSFDSLSLGSDKQPFTMPSEVPTKVDWVQNDEALECMCCRQVIFSMFNRRHHCRRCGRLICGNCSMKRMQVQTYGDILVRVCADCYEQTHQSIGTSSTKSDTISILYDTWLFTDNASHNEIVREEFSYEHAPSVSLCLAILKYHSSTEECPKFLLNQCDKMLQLIKPVQSDTHHEIDYSLLIKMIKSLAIAAKMISLQCAAKWAIAQSDRILSQIELLNLLTERGCLELIPTNAQLNGLYIDGGVLRKLRDKLLEREQWSLALEVSTKAGLDRTGVFAAWGKNCLRAGCLNLAREKFQKCFDKGHRFEMSSDNSEVEDSVDVQRSRYQSKLSATSNVSESRPMKTPPLINDIIDILESNNCIIDEKVLKLHQNTTVSKPPTTISLDHSLKVAVQVDPAICIYNKLKNLNSIVAGNYSTYPNGETIVTTLKANHQNDVYIEPLFYNECIYYLTKYASHISILQFYVKHGEMKDCLIHIVDNRLSSDVFVDIYTTCLKDGIVEMFQIQMSKIDSTLDIWKDHLKAICRHLEKHSLLNSLYQLQLFMGDYVRAAITCIRFYTDDANSYTELLNRVNYLHRAQEHLKQDLEQEQWVEVAVRKASTSSQEQQDSFHEKSLTHPSLVMKMDSRFIDKHINTIWRQIEVSRIFAEYEVTQQLTSSCLKDVTLIGNNDSNANNKYSLPTLFGSQLENIQVAILLIICGKNVEDSFGVAFRIIQDYQLKPVSVYCQAGKLLAKAENYNGIAQLVSCVRSSGISDAAVIEMCDEMLILAVRTLTQANCIGPQLDGLIKLITDRAAKISAYIESKQLKSAYLLAVKHKRMGDIRRILKEAESLNQQNIKILCQKLLQTHSNFPSHSKE